MRILKSRLVQAITATVFLVTPWASAQEEVPVRRQAVRTADHVAKQSPFDGLTLTGACCDTAPSCGECEEPSCDAGCSGGCGGEESCEDEPFKLFDGCWIKERGIDVGGFIAASYTWNPDSPAGGFNGPVTWTDRSNEAQLNNFWLYAEKAVEIDDCNWNVGWRMDAMYGSSYRWTTAAHLENHTGGRFYGLALPQFYGDVAKGKWKFRVGHFFSPVGYFGVMTSGNFFNTLPYTYQYGEPFTHTGALAYYTVSDKLTVFSGITRGWDNFGNFNPNLGFLGGLTRTFEDGSSFAMVNVWSNEPNATFTDFTSRYLQTNVYSRPINDCLTYVFQSDFGHQVSATAPGVSAEWYGVNQYLIYKVSDKWSWGFNFEWFRDDDAFRVGTLLPSPFNPNARGAIQPFLAGNYYQITVGPQWRPTQNIMVRPNARFDWFQGAGLPYDDATDSTQSILGTDVVVTF